jgi:sodium/bile acid cotransporter 7
MIVLPIMLFHQMQLMTCAVLARRYAERAEAGKKQRVSPASSEMARADG